MFIFIGTQPHSKMVEGFVELDEKGFIVTGPDLSRNNGKPKGWNLDRDPFLFETNVPGVFAVGDVRSGANRRVAAAVGEGSAGIYVVHKYLEPVHLRQNRGRGTRFGAVASVGDPEGELNVTEAADRRVVLGGHCGHYRDR